MQSWRNLNHGDDRIEIYDTLAEARERFGENYRGFVFTLTRAQAEALLQGKVVAFDIGSFLVYVLRLPLLAGFA